MYIKYVQTQKNKKKINPKFNTNLPKEDNYLSEKTKFENLIKLYKCQQITKDKKRTYNYFNNTTCKNTKRKCLYL